MPPEQITDFKPKTLDNIITEPQAEPEKTPDPAPEPETPEDKPAEAKAAGDKPSGDKELESKGEPEKAEKKGEPPAPEEPKPEAKTVPLAAQLDERRKRQGLESKVAKLETEIGELKKSPRPDPYEDPEGAAEYDRAETALKDEKAGTAQWNLLVKLDRRAMQRAHDDYDEAEAIFMEEAQHNQALAASMSQSEFPAEFAYNEGLRLKQVRAMGDNPAEYVQSQIKEGVKLALEELKKSDPALVPDSLADAPSATSREAKAWAGPKPISEIIGST